MGRKLLAMWVAGVLVLVVLSLGPVASARPMDGRLGLGGEVGTGPLGETLSVKYWVSDLGMQALFGFNAVPTTSDSVGAREYRFAARMLYALTRTRLTNLNVGVGLSMFIRDSDFEAQNPLWLELLMAPEFHLNDNFAVSAHLGLSIELGSDPSYATHSAGFGAGFHFYF